MLTADAVLQEMWRGLRDGADLAAVSYVLGAIAALRLTGRLDRDAEELWRRRIATCPGHADEGGRSWCAFCGELKRGE